MLGLKLNHVSKRGPSCKEDGRKSPLTNSDGPEADTLTTGIISLVSGTFERNFRHIIFKLMLEMEEVHIVEFSSS